MCFSSLRSFDDFFDIAAGDILDNLLVSLDTTTLGLGLYEDSIFLNPFSTLSGFADIALEPILLTLRINVRDSSGQVPLPGTLLLFVTGLFSLRYCRRRRAVH